MSLLNKVINLIIEPLIHVCNLSLGTGMFPDKMKIASVLPVYKTGNVSVLVIIDLFQFCHSFLKYLKSFIIID